MTNAKVTQGFPTPQLIGFVPCEGPKAMPLALDFTAGNTAVVNLTDLTQSGKVTSFQSIYVDNADNTAELVILCNPTAQRVIIPPGAQGYIPLLQPNPPTITFYSTGAIIVTVQLLNFFVPAMLWQAAGTSVSVNLTPSLVSMSDKSGTITLGNTAQTQINANPARKRFVVANPSTATERLRFRYGAGGWIDLLPGASWDENGLSVSTDAISLVAATTGHAFTAYEA